MPDAPAAAIEKDRRRFSHAPLVLVLHGLTGSSNSLYVLGRGPALAIAAEAALKFKELAEKKLPGKVQVQVFPSSQLFGDAKDRVDDIVRAVPDEQPDHRRAERDEQPAEDDRRRDRHHRHPGHRTR